MKEKPCAHYVFKSNVRINRLIVEGDETRYTADLQIRCAHCGLDFQFSTDPKTEQPHAVGFADGLTLRAQIQPGSQPPGRLTGDSNHE